MKNIKSLVDAKQKMLKDKLLNANRYDRHQQLVEKKEQQDKAAIINFAKLHKPVMFENEVSKDAKQKHKEEEWGGVFRQLEEDETTFNENSDQIDDEVFSNEQNEVVLKKIHYQMNKEF